MQTGLTRCFQTAAIQVAAGFLAARIRIMVRISGPKDPVATVVATNQGSAITQLEGGKERFVFGNGQPTAGFEPATRCLQNSCSTS